MPGVNWALLGRAAGIGRNSYMPLSRFASVLRAALVQGEASGF
jgi:hypothetical protein